ncbi:MAG: signal recognition particle-docking protein FtsY [Deltaproteobacteria bacterium]|nr:signal recognition particle-docking protein FtsY [Deltaproteobacteria bacterium]
MDSDIRKKSLIDKLKSGLEKTRKLLLTNVDDIILGVKVIDQRLFDELEEALIMADVGPVFTYDLIEKMKEQVKRKELDRPELLKKVLRDHMMDILIKNEKPFMIPRDQLYTIMVVGVNGTGKTTTIGKMAHQFKKEGRSVLLAAADTFRAAAIEQLAVWSQRVDVPLIKQQIDADPAAVVFDAIRAAKSGKADLIIIDTAGRLHTKVNLMEELKKIKRVMVREIPGSPHEVLLVIDATTGQNAVNQAKMFNEEIGVSGIVLTKMDGTSKGGIVFRIASELHIPIRYIGIGETVEDLRPFKSDDFINALFDQRDADHEEMNSNKQEI